MDVSISIVSYNTKDMLEKCLASIYTNTEVTSFEIIVVDNNSQDGSGEMVKTKFPQVKLVENKENLYFTKANNQAIKLSKGRYVLIMNSDVLICKGTIQNMIEFMDTNRDAGAASCFFLGAAPLSCSKFSTPLIDIIDCTVLRKLFINSKVINEYRMADWDRHSTRAVDVICDAFMMIRREAINDIGIYDEKFLLYYTENDLCMRLNKNGWKVYHYAEAEVFHEINYSTNKENTRKISRILKNDLFHYYKKYYGFITASSMWFILSINAICLDSAKFSIKFGHAGLCHLKHADGK